MRKIKFRPIWQPLSNDFIVLRCFQKPKLKPNVQYNPKRESFNRPRRPPTILPLHHEATEYQVPVRYSPNDNAIRRASVKNNPVK